jgi:Tfp pilus assembly protein PilW
MLISSRHRPTLALASEHGFSMIELLVAMASATVVLAALATVLQVSLNQERRVNEVVNVNQSGRVAMSEMVEKLHSACTGRAATAIQVPSTTPVSPLAKLNATNLWLMTTYGTESGTEAAPKQVSLQDIHWTETGTTSSGAKVGTLTDYSWNSLTNSQAPNYEFAELSSAKATSTKIISPNVILPTSPAELFQYYKYNNTPTSEKQGQLEVLTTEKEIQAAAARNEEAGKEHEPEIAKVAINFTQAPTTSQTQFGHTATFSNSVVFRFNSSETGSEVKDLPCA